MKKLLTFSALSATGYGCYKVLQVKNQLVQTYELKDIQSDYFMLVDTGHYSKEYKNFIQNIKQHLSEHLHFIPQKMDYNQPNFYENHIAVRKVKFKDDLKLKNSDQIFQGIMYSLIDTHMGALSTQLFQKQPSVTAHITYKAHKSIKANQSYWIVAYAKTIQENNAFLEGQVLDEKFEKVMNFESRFVRSQWKNMYKIKQKNPKNQTKFQTSN